MHIHSSSISSNEMGLCMSDTPLVSVGLPVFNGAKYIREALDSILAQTYPNFEVIISDNASTDSTKEICLEYTAKDSRIRYYRNKKNLGASKNFNLVFMLSSGKYFKWAAHDDLIAPRFLEKCISVLNQDQSIALCCSKIGCINEQGTLVGTHDYKLRIDSRKPDERFGDLIRISYPVFELFGVIRRSVLKRTPLIGNYIGSDKNQLAEIALIGRIHRIPEQLFFQRVHSQAYSSVFYDSARARPGYEEELFWWTGANRLSFPYSIHTRMCLEYFRSVRRAPLERFERQLCYLELVKWLIREGWIWTGWDVENILLCSSSLGRRVDSTLRRIMRRGIVPIIEKKGV